MGETVVTDDYKGGDPTTVATFSSILGHYYIRDNGTIQGENAVTLVEHKYEINDDIYKGF